MLHILMSCCLLVMFAHANAEAQQSPGTTPYWEAASDGPQTKSDADPTWIKWLKASLIASIIILIILKVTLWPSERNSRPMTPEEIKASKERMLDTVSQMRMWEAMGRGDGDSIREEMKLVELRNIRRLNE